MGMDITFAAVLQETERLLLFAKTPAETVTQVIKGLQTSHEQEVGRIAIALQNGLRGPKSWKDALK